MMKNFLTACIFGLLSLSVSAQGAWLDVGANVSYGPTIMANSNIFESSRIEHQINSGISYGARVGLNFGEFHSMNILYNYSELNQNFDLNIAGQQLSDLEYTWTTNDVMLLYRYSGYGVYVELGPKYSLINTVEQGTNTSSAMELDSDLFEDYFAGVLGFGTYIAGNDALSINLGLRLSYAFTDMVANETPGVIEPSIIEFDDYSSTNPLTAQLNLEVNYVFGRFAKQTCSGRNKLILFGR